MLAYVLALQMLLGVWAGAAQASGSLSFDSALSLCRTMTPGDTQPADGQHSVPAHCAVMCLSGACGSTEPPAAMMQTADFPPARIMLAPAFVLLRPSLSSIAGSGLHARGPPSIG
jgi:hypothetical protein